MPVASVDREGRGQTALVPWVDSVLGIVLRECDAISCANVMRCRLASTAGDMLRFSHTLQDKGVELTVIGKCIDTSRLEGRLLFAMTCAIADFECERLRERQAEGIEAVKRKSRCFGRLGVIDAKRGGQNAELAADGDSSSHIGCIAGVSESSVGRALKEVSPREQ